MDKIKEVAIAIPCAQVVEPRVLQSMLTLVSYTSWHSVKITEIGVTERQMVDDARNGLAEAFLASPTEWMFWMDSDMLFPPETLIELIKVAEEKEAKFVTGVYYQRKGNNMPCLWTRGAELSNGELSAMGSIKAQQNKYVGAFTFPHPDKKDPFKIHAAGFGCILVHRSIFEKMDRPWFKFLPGTCSEDFYFCVNAKELGYDLWAVPGPVLGHIGDAPVITKVEFFKKLENSKQEVQELILDKEKV